MELFANNIKLPFRDTLSVKFANPMFNDIGSHSLPVTFNARDPRVRRAFGFQSKPEAEVIDSVPGEVREGYLNLLGSWKVTSSGETIEAYFKCAHGDFYSRIKDVNLPDIDFGGVRRPPFITGHWDDMLAEMVNHIDTYYPLSEYVAYCAYMPNAAGASEHPELKMVNPVTWDPTSEAISFQNLEYGNNSIYLFVATVLQYLFESNGYRISSNVFTTDNELKRLTIFNTFNFKPPTTSINWNLSVYNYADLVPKVSCADFLKALRNRFNVGIFINEQSRTVTIKKYDEIIAKGLSHAISGRILRTENNRMPGVSFKLNAPCDYSNHLFQSSSNLSGATVVAKYRDILPNTRTADELIFVTTEQTYYKIIYTAAAEGVPESYVAEKLCSNQFPYSEGTTPEDIDQLSGSLAMYTSSKVHQYYYQDPPNPPVLMSADIDMLLPRCDLKGNREGFENNNYPLIFMSARYGRCWVEDEVGAPYLYYPFGSSDIYDAMGNVIAGADLALKWNGEKGIIAKFWPNRLAWEQKIKKLLKADVLARDVDKLIDFTESKRIGNNNVLVNSFDVKLGGKEVVVENVELLRL